jgi:pilus assembly protein CpaB
MPKRRVAAAIVAVVLAALGAVLLTSYVSAADQRAVAGTKTLDVLVVTKQVLAGTSADKLDRLVSTKALPSMAVATGAVSSLSELTGQVATTDLMPGEQLIASRFSDPAALPDAGKVAIPAGMQQVSLSLESRRALGGHLVAGTTVGLFISTPKDGSQPAETHLALHKVLVSRVDGGVSSGSSGSSVASGPSSDAVLITLVLSAANAEKVVYGAEFGTIWLSSEPADAIVAGTRVVTGQTVNK